MLTEKIVKLGFQILASLIAYFVDVASILPEDHDICCASGNEPEYFLCALKITNPKHHVSDIIKLEKNTHASPPAEAMPTLATTYRAINELLIMLAPIGLAFAEECWAYLHTISPPSLGCARVLNTMWPWLVLQGEFRGGETIYTEVQGWTTPGKVRTGRTIGDYSPSAWTSGTSKVDIIHQKDSFNIMRHHSCSPGQSPTVLGRHQQSPAVLRLDRPVRTTESRPVPSGALGSPPAGPRGPRTRGAPGRLGTLVQTPFASTRPP